MIRDLISNNKNKKYIQLTALGGCVLSIVYLRKLCKWPVANNSLSFGILVCHPVLHDNTLNLITYSIEHGNPHIISD